MNVEGISKPIRKVKNNEPKINNLRLGVTVLSLKLKWILFFKRAIVKGSCSKIATAIKKALFNTESLL